MLDMFVVVPLKATSSAPTATAAATTTTTAVTNTGSSQVLAEATNSLKHPTGPEFQFHANEGTYLLRDDYQLATPLPHPSEGSTSTNPLSTHIPPPTAGTKLSVIITSDKKAPPVLYNLDTDIPNLSTYSIKEQEESRPSQDTNANSSDINSQPLSVSSDKKGTTFGAANVFLNAINGGKEGAKKKKPKTNMMKTSSNFISRVVPHEALSRRLNERDPDSMLVFANINRSLQWLDLTSTSHFKSDHLTKILFTKAHMLCHDINKLTKGSNHLDLVAGSSHADIIWYEPFSIRYNRINKNGVINPAPVLDVKWFPGSENLFLAAHTDGTLMVYDKERDDGVLTVEGTIAEDFSTKLQVNKSINSVDQKTNPVASWKTSNQQINAISFSPDCRHLAVASQDGSLRIIDHSKEKLLDHFKSYYGAFTCVCWSPDGKYVLTGGQDDLVTIWSFHERCLVARCHGHSAFVSAIAFDPWRCNQKNYRFGSVGEDGKLLLWDFNYNTLSKPKAAQRIRGSVASSAPLTRHRTDSIPPSRLRSNSSLTANIAPAGDEIKHPVVPRAQASELPPVMSKAISDEPLCGLIFQEDCIITSCTTGHIRIWDRPKEGAGSPG